MSILWMSLLGLVVGTLGGLLVSGRPGGLITPVLVGGAGAVLAGSTGSALGWSSGPLSGPGLVVSVLGALLAVVVFGLTVNRRLRMPGLDS